MKLTLWEIETLIGYLGELMESSDTPEQDHYTLAHVYSKLVQDYTKQTLALTGAELKPSSNMGGELLKQEIAAHIALLNYRSDNDEYLRGQVELAMHLIGYTDDGDDLRAELTNLRTN